MEQTINNDQYAVVVDVQFRPGQKVYFFDPRGKNYEIGDRVIIDTARGPEYGICTAGNHTVPQNKVVAPLRPVLRKANAHDERAMEENRKVETDAMQFCQDQIVAQKLDMQLVSVECSFDGSKLLFFFTADERVDFRELVKSLASAFHTRIELRQIGVRDKARMVGGLGICGRPFCCATFLEEFVPVSIKMAKTQNLSLNPTKISGTCGRLMCCLKYEQEAYEDLVKNSPKADSFVDTPDGRGTITEIELLRQRVKVRMEAQPETVGVYKNDEIAVYRVGKAKKNDPPIPADWAPISGNQTPRRRFESEEKFMGLDAIKFRYSTDTVAESVEEQKAAEPEVEAPDVELTQEVKENRNSRRNRRNRKAGKVAQNQADAPKSQKTAPKPEKQETAKSGKKEHPKQPKQEPSKQPKPEAPKQNAGEDAQKKKHHHHRRYHHRKPKTGENQQ